MEGETPPKIYENGTNSLELIGKVSADGDWGAIQVKNDATLTIFGNGESHAINRTGYGTNVWSSGTSKVIINGGYFTNEPDTVLNDPTHVDLIYATENSSIEIYGGTFKDVTPKWTLNAKDHKENQTATITVYGGTYYQFDPANPNVGEGEVILADGYISIQEGDWYTVYKEQPDKIELDKDSTSIEVGKTLSLNATLEPSNTLKSVTWKSSDSEIATVDNKGNVTAVAPGTVEIVATAGDVSDTCKVNVYKVEDPMLPNDESDVTVDSGANEVLGNTTSSIVEEVKNGETPSNVEFTNEQAKKELVDAETITTEVVAKPVEEEKVEETTIKAIDEVLVESDKENNKKSEVVQYLDLSVLLKADNKVVGNVTELNESITFNVAVPKELQKDGTDFYVVRVHDGKAERLADSKYDFETGIVTFTTDKFSTYALVSEEKAVEVPEEEMVNVTISAIIDGQLVEEVSEVVQVPKGYEFTKEDIDLLNKEIENILKDQDMQGYILKGLFLDKEATKEFSVGTSFEEDGTIYLVFEKEQDTTIEPLPDDNNPKDPPKEESTNPDTGDKNNIVLYASLAGVALLGSAILLLNKKRDELK